MFYRQLGGDAHKDHGYVNAHHILFPIGHKFPGGHVSSFDVVLRKCPACNEVMTSSNAVKGICSNDECAYSALDYLDSISEV